MLYKSDLLILHKSIPRWQISGGRVDVVCGILYRANSMIFDGAGERKACTPFMDTRTAGNLRFYFGFGKSLMKFGTGIEKSGRGS